MYSKISAAFEKLFKVVDLDEMTKSWMVDQFCSDKDAFSDKPRVSSSRPQPNPTPAISSAPTAPIVSKVSQSPVQSQVVPPIQPAPPKPIVTQPPQDNSTVPVPILATKSSSSLRPSSSFSSTKPGSQTPSQSVVPLIVSQPGQPANLLVAPYYMYFVITFIFTEKCWKYFPDLISKYGSTLNQSW